MDEERRQRSPQRQSHHADNRSLRYRVLPRAAGGGEISESGSLAGSPILRSHDLEDIYDQCLAVAPGLALDRMELSALTPYAVLLRYDMEFWPDQATAQKASAIVDRVRAAVLAVLPTSAHP